MKSVFLFLGSFSAFMGVVLGAFGAHALKTTLNAEALAIYQTGITYQMWHALGLVGIACLHHQMPDSKLIPWAGWLMFIGILLFSGSLCLLAILNLHWLGMITPIGGTCFLIAWLLVSFSATKKKTTSRYQ
jgi:uncharacterized membrane protein YgdD (TMEM256/DUF423 family)